MSDDDAPVPPFPSAKMGGDLSHKLRCPPDHQSNES